MNRNSLARIAAAAPAAAFGYALTEARRYRLKHHTLPVLPQGAGPLKILQVSDLHLRPSLRKMASFLRSLDGEEYDFVVATGDLLGDPESVEQCIDLLAGLRATSGKFVVLGSSDYYAPVFKNYFDYLSHRRRHGPKRNPTAKLLRGLKEAGWQDMCNQTTNVSAGGLSIQFTGLDDPYLGRDDRSLLLRDPGAGVAVCLVHDPAPYALALERGFDLVISGHTHGGQVRLPGAGAIVTNSTLPRRYARWSSKIGDGWLFVSPGLGTGKFAPIRFMCPPEASVLHLTPRSESGLAAASLKR